MPNNFVVLLPLVLSAIASPLSLVNALPSSYTSITKVSPPVPIVIWHGLGDRFDAPGLIELKSDLESEPALKGVFVHLVNLTQDGTSDQRATFFGKANDQVATVCDDLKLIPEIMDRKFNPSAQVDIIGFSQGGQLSRALVERCSEIRFRKLITLGSQHMGISSPPPCPPGSSPFSICKLFQLSLLKNGLYSSWAQSNLVPAQYTRDEARIDDYLQVNDFLRDINNERIGDRQVGPPEETGSRAPRRILPRGGDDDDAPEKRNSTYKRNFERLEKFIMFRFTMDTTVVPPQSAHFTLPSPQSEPCPVPVDPACYRDPVAWSDLPLYSEDYIGLKTLDKRGKVWRGVCEGAHMQIDDECWGQVVDWLVGDRLGQEGVVGNEGLVLQN